MLKNFTTLYLILKEKDHQQGYPLDWIEAIGSGLEEKRVVVIDADNNSQSVGSVKKKLAQNSFSRYHYT